MCCLFLGLPDPHLDPLVTTHKYRSGSGSGSFHHQAKIERKTLISTVLRFLYDFFSVFRNRIQICMYLCLPDPHPDPLDRVTNRRIRVRGSWSVPKCHGSTTLLQSYNFCVEMCTFFSDISRSVVRSILRDEAECWLYAWLERGCLSVYSINVLVGGGGGGGISNTDIYYCIIWEQYRYIINICTW